MNTSSNTWSRLERIRSVPILLVSPHHDDAWLSCSAILRRTDPVHVLTVFAGMPEREHRTAWDIACGFSNSTEAVMGRREEQRGAFLDTPHRVELMNLVEGQYLDGPRREKEPEHIALVARDWLRTRPTGVVLGPAGAGAHGKIRATLGRARRRSHRPPHPDHILVCDALAQSVPPRSLVLFEEFPHRRSGRADQAAKRIAGRRGELFAHVDLTVDRRAKAAAAACYPSQLRGYCGDGTQFSSPAVLDTTERYWLPTP